MPRVTLGVAISVPSPWAEELAAWRKRVGDPEGARVPPHVTLLPPTAVPSAKRAAIDAHLAEAAAAIAPFDMHLSGTGTFRPVSDVVFVVVAAGIAQCEQLESLVRSGPLGRETRFPYHPHVTVAHDIDAAGLDAAYEGLTGFEARFRVTCFTAFEQGEAGVWVPRREFTLEGE
ncbi:MAG TPA: 2'-5' RNA ligase family protein [Mycobacteriales bacterium]